MLVLAGGQIDVHRRRRQRSKGSKLKENMMLPEWYRSVDKVAKRSSRHTYI